MLIVCQMGHVGRTTGATGAPGEQEFAAAAGQRVKHHVEALGHQVRLIKADVPNDQYRGDLFLALHYDSSDNPSARGASVGWQTAEGRRFADAWKRAYLDAGWSGGFRGDNYTAALAGYYGVRRAVTAGNRRAFIAEAGFHSSPLDAALLAAPAGPDRVGRAVAAAVAEIVGGSQPDPQPVEDDMPDIKIYDCTTRPALLFGAGPVRRLDKTQRDALRSRGIDAEAVDAATSDALWSLAEAPVVDVNEAAIAAAVAGQVTPAVIAALPDELTDHLTVDDVEATMRTVLEGVYAAAATAATGS